MQQKSHHINHAEVCPLAAFSTLSVVHPSPLSSSEHFDTPKDTFQPSSSVSVDMLLWPRRRNGVGHHVSVVSAFTECHMFEGHPCCRVSGLRSFSSTGRCLGCSHFGDRAAGDTHAQGFVWTYVFMSRGCVPLSGRWRLWVSQRDAPGPHLPGPLPSAA